MADWRDDVKEILKSEEETRRERQAQSSAQRQATEAELWAATQKMAGWLGEAQRLLAGKSIEPPIFSAKGDMGSLQCFNHSVTVELKRTEQCIVISVDGKVSDEICYSSVKCHLVRRKDEVCLDLEPYFGSYIRELAAKVKRPG